MKMKLFIFLFLIGCNSPVSEVVKSVSENVTENFSHEIMEKIILPDEKQLDVIFYPQAPFANWDVHNDSCEEAGILLAHAFYTGENLSREQADEELKNMIKYQENNYGGHFDIFTDDIARLAREYYGYEPRVEIVDVEKIREEIYTGNPVILLTTAAYLKPEKNDYPEMGYHIILAVGYNQSGIITHDVGTITGENTFYSNQTILNAIADYDYKAVILK